MVDFTKEQAETVSKYLDGINGYMLKKESDFEVWPLGDLPFRATAAELIEIAEECIKEWRNA